MSTLHDKNFRCRQQSLRNKPPGFGVFMLEAVIGGLGDELINLAKANLFR
jgi:hypothetical protein